MKISVLIPTYNSSATIRPTLESVLEQTALPDEVLVLDDGSTDDTLSILDTYKPQVSVFRQANEGVAGARNALCARAQGDLIAFLDHDDIWHPEYLRRQQQLFESHPSAVASYVGHVDFYGYGNYQWEDSSPDESADAELIEPLDFFVRYNRSTGNFGSMSYCCVRASALKRMGGSPFRIDGVDDSYLSFELALLGPVIYAPESLVAYRITQGSFSTDRLKTFGRWVKVFELMRPQYEASGDSRLLQAFKRAFASKRRAYSKMLMGANKVADAREQLRRSLEDSSEPTSLAKSLTILSMTYLPPVLHPTWLSGIRESEERS
jgi:glycosyltransferase involved in cell wall biosynthesis